MLPKDLQGLPEAQQTIYNQNPEVINTDEFFDSVSEGGTKVILSNDNKNKQVVEEEGAEEIEVDLLLNQSLFESVGSISDKKKASQMAQSPCISKEMDKDSDSNQNVEDDFESCKDNCSVTEQTTANRDQEQDQDLYEEKQTTPEKISFSDHKRFF